MRTTFDLFLFLLSIAVIGAVLGYLFCTVVIPDMQKEIRTYHNLQRRTK